MVATIAILSRFRRIDLEAITVPGACVVLFLVRREVQPPPTNLLPDWIDSWSQWFRGGRRRTGSTLAIPAGAALGFVELVVHCVGGLERGVQTYRSGRSRASMGRTEEQAEHELRQTVACTQVR